MSLPRKTFLVALLALAGLVAVAGSAAAAEKSFTVVGKSEGGEYWFEFEGETGNNPTVRLEAGDEVTITFTSADSVHNIAVGAPVSKKTEMITDGEEAQVLQFTVPAELDGKTLQYWCDPHKGLGMAGTFQVGEPKADDGAGDATAKSAPGFDALLGFAAVGVAAVAFGARRLRA